MGDFVLNPFGGSTDSTKWLLRLPFYRFLRRLLWLLFRSFFNPFVRGLIRRFLLVSIDLQAKLAAKVHRIVVVSWNCDHVSGLKDLSIALDADTILGGWGKMTRQADSGAEELRRAFSLECCLAFQ